MEDMESRLVGYVEPILRFCIRRLSCRQDAECLSQEILAHVLEGISRYHIDDLDRWVRDRYSIHGTDAGRADANRDDPSQG